MVQAAWRRGSVENLAGYPIWELEASYVHVFLLAGLEQLTFTVVEKRLPENVVFTCLDAADPQSLQALVIPPPPPLLALRIFRQVFLDDVIEVRVRLGPAGEGSFRRRFLVLFVLVEPDQRLCSIGHR